MKWNGALHHVAKFAVPDALNHKQIDADRWGNLPHLDEQHENDTKPDRINAVLQQHGVEQRHRDNDHAQAFDEASKHGVKYEQCKKERKLRKLQVNEKLSDLLTHAGIAD